jgi:hypothetical protein
MQKRSVANTMLKGRSLFAALSFNAKDVVENLELSSLEVVLFGVGDFRLDDHGGLHQALKNEQSSSSQGGRSRILPLVVLDDASVGNLAGAVAHSIDTANMLVQALTDLKQELAQELNLPLHVLFRSDYDAVSQTAINKSNNSISKTVLQHVIRPLLEQSSKSGLSSTSTINIHVCDLGPADNRMGYGPYGNWMRMMDNSTQKTCTTDTIDANVQVTPWSCPLWADPWEQVDTLPNSYPTFAQRYKTRQVVTPSDRPVAQTVVDDFAMPRSVMDGLAGVSTSIPNAAQVYEWMQSTLGLDPNRCREEQNTGLFGTHWGGLDPTTVGEVEVLETLRLYVDDCQQDDQVFASKRLTLMDSYCQRNVHSLEHASMIWNLRGESSSSSSSSSGSNTNGKANSSSSSFVINTGNIMAGEMVIRYLAAPLWLGTVSPRRVWHACNQPQPHQPGVGAMVGKLLGGLLSGDQDGGSSTPLQSFVEAREWHRLLAARNIQTDPAYSSSALGEAGELKYDYFRWHGFLCHYAKAALVADSDSSNNNSDKSDTSSGLLFVHGFGASGSQWAKTIRALAAQINHSKESSGTMVEQQALAPDLIGFGQSEKPPITYSGYTWEGYIGDFVKEIAQFKNQWTDFAVGGNSIGGFTAMCSAANDATTSTTTAAAQTSGNGSSPRRIVVSGMGSPGTGRCTGAILMNPAGNIQTKEEVEQTAVDTVRLASVAQVTASDSLAPCK